MNGWATIAWEEGLSIEALSLIAREAGIEARQGGLEKFASRPQPGDDRWIALAADTLGFEAEPVSCTYAEVLTTLRALGPALIRIPHENGPRVLAVIRSDDRALLVLTPARQRMRVGHQKVVAALTRPLEGRAGERVDRWLAQARIAPRRMARARDHLLREIVGDRRVTGFWLIRTHPGASIFRELHRQGASRRVIIFTAAAIAQIALGVTSWLLLGRGALGGVVETGWLVAWCLVILTGVGAQILSSWMAGCLSVDIGLLLKRRLLCGALGIEAEEIAHRGSGAMLATVAESTTVERLGFAGIISVLTASIQLVSAAFVLFAGVGGTLHACLLAVWLVLVAIASLRVSRYRAQWTQRRFAMTNDFVEKTIGNRTRVVQQRPDDWHIEEDRVLENYATSSERLDRAQHLLGRLPARGWLAVGLLGLVPALLSDHDDRIAIAISIAGILQAQGGIAMLTGALGDLSAAFVAWKSIGRLYKAAERAEPAASPAAAIVAQSAKALAAGTPVLEARGLAFSYGHHGMPVLRQCDLLLRYGDRVLLEGSSGSGKSTLVSLLTGLHSPTGGLILLRGFDRPTLGGFVWKRGISSAPQFHKNHVFANTLAFNLLMGRTWPPGDEDLTEAAAVCRELGLGALLDRMPSGLDQVVGETGWQLSHGERSRIFLARAILQDADIVLLDETFGALDPLTMQTCMECAKRRARTLVVIAHP